MALPAHNLSPDPSQRNGSRLSIDPYCSDHPSFRVMALLGFQDRKGLGASGSGAQRSLLCRALSGAKQHYKFLCSETLSKGSPSVPQALVQQTFFSLLELQPQMGDWKEKDNPALLPVPRSMEPWMRQTAEPVVTTACHVCWGRVIEGMGGTLFL